MKRVVASIIIVALVLGAIYGAVSSAAAAISVGGDEPLGGGSVAVSDIETAASCNSSAGVISGSVACSTVP